MNLDTTQTSNLNFGAKNENAFENMMHQWERRYQTILDRMNGRFRFRWILLAVLYIIYFFRAFIYPGGWYIVTYGLGIYVLNMFIAFITPKWDPEEEELDPYKTKSDDKSDKSLPGFDSSEAKPFIRRLPEFTFWWELFKAIVVCLFFTTSRAFDIPVFWPILLGYWILLFLFTMRQQIRKMIKYNYLPWTTGKKKYGKGNINAPAGVPMTSNKTTYSPVVNTSNFGIPVPFTTTTHSFTPVTTTSSTVVAPPPPKND